MSIEHKIEPLKFINGKPVKKIRRVQEADGRVSALSVEFLDETPDFNVNLNKEKLTVKADGRDDETWEKS
jgi:hypothetical protein